MNYQVCKLTIHVCSITQQNSDKNIGVSKLHATHTSNTKNQSKRRHITIPIYIKNAKNILYEKNISILYSFKQNQLQLAMVKDIVKSQMKLIRSQSVSAPLSPDISQACKIVLARKLNVL